MGQKINPIGLRVGIIRGWDSLWFIAKQKNYTLTLLEDIHIRKFVKLRLKNAGVAKVVLKPPSRHQHFSNVI